jgi:glycosyltransferase involved in cell wall biosynthesis
MCKVSVIIPVYNTQNYLRQCLDSVVEQTLIDIEVIIVNDGSTDNSSNIINEYLGRDERFTCVSHGVNEGLPEARNSGVLIAQGKYVIHLDSDDYWLDEGALEALYQTAEIDGCDVLKFNGLHHINGSCVRPIFNPEYIINGSFESEKEFWQYRSIFLYFFKKQFLDENNLEFIRGINLGEDAIFLSSALPCSKRISTLPRTFYAYRVDNLSLMRKPWTLENFIQEENAARIVSGNIKHVKDAFDRYWSFRFSHYWVYKLMPRAFAELNDDEKVLLVQFMSETAAEINGEDLICSGYLSPVGKEIVTLLLKNDALSLEEYVRQQNERPGSNPRVHLIKRASSYLRRKLKYLLKKVYNKLEMRVLYRALKATNVSSRLKRINDRVAVKARIKKRLALFHMKNKVFSNIEELSDYNFTLSKKNKPRGISAMLRVKNEENYIVGCLESIVELFDEIAVIDNASSDSTACLVNNFKNNHPLGHRVTFHSYPFSVARCGAENEATNENSLKSLAYFYNWCVSRCRYSMICKWDADMLLSSQMKSREIFKRYLSKIVLSKGWCAGSIPVQTVYIDNAHKKFISQGEVHRETRLFPSVPAVYFAKGLLWEVLKMELPIHNIPLGINAVYELKDVKEDEFSHWSSDTFIGKRKVNEYRNYMYIKKSMHLYNMKDFLKTDRL